MSLWKKKMEIAGLGKVPDDQLTGEVLLADSPGKCPIGQTDYQIHHA